MQRIKKFTLNAKIYKENHWKVKPSEGRRPVVTLWQKLTRNCVKTPSGCWRYQGATDQDGYALVRVGKQVRRGHQVMCEIHNGRPIPPGYQPDHPPAG